MSKILFQYMKNQIILNTSNYTIFEIIKEYSSIINVDTKNLYILYKGKYLSPNQNNKKKIKEIFKNNIILKVFNLNKTRIRIESNFILCPECNNLINISNKEDKINLAGCINDHKIKDLTLNLYINSQLKKKSIKCNKCKENINFFHNKYFFCSCGNIFCYGCKEKHINKTGHNMIEYKERYYKCAKHSNIFISYCNDCKENLCSICELEHINHKKTLYKKIELKGEKLNKIYQNLKYLKKTINQYQIELKKMKEIFEKIISMALEDLKKYKKLYHQLEFISNNLKNYESYNCLNNINIKKLIQNLDTFINNDLNYKFQYLVNFYKISEKKIALKYHNKEKEEKIRLFGEDFVKNNKNNCYLLINNNISELCEYYFFDQEKKGKTIIVDLIKDKVNIKGMFKDCKNLLEISNIIDLGTDIITDVSYLFYGCSSLISLPDISNLILVNVTNMSYLFYGCSSITSLPDISLWKPLSAIDISYMFYGCSSLTSLPNISKWNLDKITNMNNLFSHCSNLSTLPDISKWNTNKVIDMNNMFSFCKVLVNLPDISKWNTNKVIDMSCMFSNCSTLQFLPNIEKWDIGNVKYLNGIFSNCSSLLKFPDISSWNTINVINMNAIFYNCKSLKNLPDISNWKVNNVTNMNGIFYKCKSLISLPDISIWNTSKVINMNNMFSNCESLTSLPDLSKWNKNKNIKYENMFNDCKKSLKIPDKFKNN